MLSESRREPDGGLTAVSRVEAVSQVKKQTISVRYSIEGYNCSPRSNVMYVF